MTYTGIGEQQRIGAGSNAYQYDGTGMSSHTSSGSTDTYTTTPGGALISETISSGTYYYLWDGSGSVVGLTDSSGAVVNTYAYDPMGNVTTTTGTTANPFTFQGMMYDSSNGFYYSGSGYYDPATGQDFGCKKDRGHADTWSSEDACGEDEAPYDDVWTKSVQLHTVGNNGLGITQLTGTRLTVTIRYTNPNSGAQVEATASMSASTRYHAGSQPGTLIIGGRGNSCGNTYRLGPNNTYTSSPCLFSTSGSSNGFLDIEVVGAAPGFSPASVGGGTLTGLTGISATGSFRAHFPV